MNTAQMMKFSFKDFFCKCDQIRSFPRIWSPLLKKSLLVNFIFCAVQSVWTSIENIQKRELFHMFFFYIEI